MRMYPHTGAHYDKLAHWYIKYLRQDKEYYYKEWYADQPLSLSSLTLFL